MRGEVPGNRRALCSGYLEPRKLGAAVRPGVASLPTRSWCSTSPAAAVSGRRDLLGPCSPAGLRSRDPQATAEPGPRPKAPSRQWVLLAGPSRSPRRVRSCRPLVPPRQGLGGVEGSSRAAVFASGCCSFTSVMERPPVATCNRPEFVGFFIPHFQVVSFFFSPLWPLFWLRWGNYPPWERRRLPTSLVLQEVRLPF